ncbi:hypothetical protein TRFO_20159 [Tritrichomonas foetus]|uniref:Protein kinase domain-containing protein n=1 Tax=Tritrichomonas foetus TaxID=1144522 RepID=A0A1J4KHU0_9EUKA|nr:hypothetical protein TRFO_20159 [Tritrichomonas foetus]|eukprot:OHT10496.1 hypothetical protein TRFO_20159 [Tritrichomonas foetus]
MNLFTAFLDHLVNPTNYKIGDPTGQGAFSTVYKATDKEAHVFAYKKLNRDENLKFNKTRKNCSEESQAEIEKAIKLKTQAIKLFFREIFNQIYGEHPCVLPNIGWNIVNETYQSEFIIVSPFMEKGDLFSNLKKNKLTPTDKINIFYGLCRGMAHLHSLNIIHRDIKPANIFLDDNNYPLIADLGLAKCVGPEELAQSRTCGTPFFLPPEALQSVNYSFSIDVYAAGMIYYLLVENLAQPRFRVKPQEGWNKDSLLRLLLDEHRPYMTVANEKQQALILKMLATDPSARPTFKSIVDDIDQNGEKSGYWFEGASFQEFDKYRRYINQKEPTNREALVGNFLDDFGKGDITQDFLMSMIEATMNGDLAARDYYGMALLTGKLGITSSSLALNNIKGKVSASKALKSLLESNGVIESESNVGEIIERAKKGDIEAVAVYGALLHKGGHLEQGERLLKIAADKGNTIACQTLGHVLLDAKKPEEAFKYFQRAADKMHPDAPYLAGYAAMMAKKKPEAMQYFKMAETLYDDREAGDHATVLQYISLDNK